MLDLLLLNGNIPGRGLVDLAVDEGRIVDQSTHPAVPARQEIDLEGRLLIPGFVESHVHLDIALMNSWEMPGRPQLFRSLSGLNEEVERRRAAFTKQEVEARAGLALELASRHGVTALRAQCHVDPEIGLKHLEALLAVKERYAGRVSVQIVAFPQQGLLRQPGTLDLFRQAFRMGADVMGCAPNLDMVAAGGFRESIDAALDLAVELDVDLDVHADLSLPERVELAELEVVYLARRVIERGFTGRVAAGHVCALDSVQPDVAEQAIELIRDAQISVISQPDLYRLGRDDKRSVRRGLTRVKGLLAAGVNVCYASNNVRDAFRPLGNFNLLEEGMILAYGAHMDSVSELETLLQMCTYNAATALRLEAYGLEQGCRADMVVIEAASPSAAIVDQAEKRYVFKAGKLVSANLAPRELLSGAALSLLREDIRRGMVAKDDRKRG